MPRTKNVYENADYVAMLSRMVRGLGRRLEDGDPDGFGDAVRLQRELDDVIRASILRAREVNGWSWAQIAAELGVTKQAAQQRYGKA